METIKFQAEKFLDVEVRVLFIPRKSDECLEILTKNNICNADRVDEINIFLIPIAQNLLSLEMHDSFIHSMN